MEEEQLKCTHNQMTFPYIDFTTTKFINDLKKNVIFYLAIAIICSILGIMHTIKNKLLDDQLQYLDNYIQNEMLIIKSEQPHNVLVSTAGLPITNDEYNQITSIQNITCFPMYEISNWDSDEYEYNSLSVLMDQNVIEILEQRNVKLVPYFSDQIIKDNLIEGSMDTNGIYVSENFASYLNHQNLLGLSFDLDVFIPTYYTTEGIEGQINNENYIYVSPVFLGEIENVKFENFDGVISADYLGYSNNQCNIYVPYSYIEELVSKHQSHENKIAYDIVYEPYTFGSIYYRGE